MPSQNIHNPKDSFRAYVHFCFCSYAFLNVCVCFLLGDAGGAVWCWWKDFVCLIFVFLLFFYSLFLVVVVVEVVLTVTVDDIKVERCKQKNADTPLKNKCTQSVYSRSRLWSAKNMKHLRMRVKHETNILLPRSLKSLLYISALNSLPVMI